MSLTDQVLFVNKRKFTKSIQIEDEVWCVSMDCSMIVQNIRVDSSGLPIFDLESFYYPKFNYIARFEEILEIY